MANCVDPDEMAHHEPYHLDLHCLQKYQFWSAGLKGLFISRPMKCTYEMDHYIRKSNQKHHYSNGAQNDLSLSLFSHAIVVLKVIFANSVDPDQTAPLGAV